MKTIKKCAMCGREFEGDHRQKYCCDDCKRKRHNARCKKSRIKRQEYEKRKAAAAQRRAQRAARHEEKPAPDPAPVPVPKPAPAARRKPVVLGNKMTLNEAVKALKEYNKKHGTNLSYGYAVVKGII